MTPMDIFIALNGSHTGPYTEDQIREMLNAGRIHRYQMAWRDGLSEWLPLEKVIVLDSLPQLPPLPPDLPPPGVATQPQIRDGQAILTGPHSPAIRTASGIIALILAVLASMNIASCRSAEQKLVVFESGNDSSETARMFVEGMHAISQGDPSGVFQGALDRHEALKQDAESSNQGAWLCLIGMGVAGGVFIFSTPKRI